MMYIHLMQKAAAVVAGKMMDCKNLNRMIVDSHSIATMVEEAVEADRRCCCSWSRMRRLRLLLMVDKLSETDKLSGTNNVADDIDVVTAVAVDSMYYSTRCCMRLLFVHSLRLHSLMFACMYMLVSLIEDGGVVVGVDTENIGHHSRRHSLVDCRSPSRYGSDFLLPRFMVGHADSSIVLVFC